jgi:hypothetical protein
LAGAFCVRKKESLVVVSGTSLLVGRVAAVRVYRVLEIVAVFGIGENGAVVYIGNIRSLYVLVTFGG